MTWISDVATGICQHLADAGLGTYTPDGVIGSSGVIVRGALPVDATGIGVQPYRAAGDDPVHPYSFLRIQLYLRQLPHLIDDLDADAYDAMQGAKNLTFGAAVTGRISSISSIPMGMSGQYAERACNYQIPVNLPETTNRRH